MGQRHVADLRGNQASTRTPQIDTLLGDSRGGKEKTPTVEGSGEEEHPPTVPGEEVRVVVATQFARCPVGVGLGDDNGSLVKFHLTSCSNKNLYKFTITLQQCATEPYFLLRGSNINTTA